MFLIKLMVITAGSWETIGSFFVWVGKGIKRKSIKGRNKNKKGIYKEYIKRGVFGIYKKFFEGSVDKCRMGGITKHPRGCSGELNTP